MKRPKIPFLLGTLVVAIGLAFPQAGPAQEGPAGGTIAAMPDEPLMPIPDARSSWGAEGAAVMPPDAPSGPSQALSTAAPAAPLPIAVPARPYVAVSVGPALVAGPRRACRRPPLPTVGIAVAPRYVYPGHLAPWGSLPLSYYAASIPIPFRLVQPAGYLERPDGLAGRAYRPSDQTPAEPSLRFVPESSPQSPERPIPPPPEPGPEAIPVPVPMEAPASSSSGRPGTGSEVKVPAVATEKPAPPGTTSGTPSEGPREF